MSSLIIIYLFFNIDIDQAGADESPTVLGKIRFKQGEETIPINGTSLPLSVNETVWLLALNDIEVDFGSNDQKIISNEQISAGMELALRVGEIDCCEDSVEYRLRITLQSELDDSAFEEATLLYIGSDEHLDVFPSKHFGGDSIRIMLDGLPQGQSTHLALLKPGLEKSNSTGRYGKIQYQSVVTPQSTLRIIYDSSSFTGVTESTIHFMLISTRTFLSEFGESETIIRMYRDGIVASNSVKLNRTTENIKTVNLNLASLGEPGIGGDTPLQLGLHFLYIRIGNEAVITREEGEKNVGVGDSSPYPIYGEEEYGGANTVEEGVFIPIYVLKNGEYTLLDQTLSSEEGVNLEFTKEIPAKVLIVATPLLNGVTSSLSTAELNIPLTKIILYDGNQRIDDYLLSFEPSLPSTRLGGVTYVMGETFSTKALLSRVKVSNFTLTNYKINGGRISEIGFPEILNLTTKLNRVNLAAVNELGESLLEGWIRVEKGEESYIYSLDSSQTLRIPDGTYTFNLIIEEGPEVEKTITVDSSQTITLTASTVKTIDIVLLTIMLIEISAAAILGVMIFRNT